MKLHSLLMFLLAGLMAGCVQLREDPLPLDGAAGARYRVREELLVLGIKRKLPSADYDYVNLYSHPGVGGPEVVKLGVMPAGTVLEITGLIRRGSGPFEAQEYQVRILGSGFGELQGRDIRISDTAAFRLYEKSDPHGPPVLSARYFERLPGN